jgi:hypothetical protein
VQQRNDRGLHFRPNTWKIVHAYASQTISGLQVGHTYTITGYMGCESPAFNNGPTTYRVYFEAIGGLGTVTSPDAPIDPDNAPSWDQFTIQQKPDADGKIEIRLHFDKYDWATYGKNVVINGYFDEFSVIY